MHCVASIKIDPSCMVCGKPLEAFCNIISLRNNVVYCKEPKGRSIMIASATKSFKRISGRISILVCGIVYPFMCGLWSRYGVCSKLWGDCAFDDLCVCVRCRICSGSVCLGLWETGLAMVCIVLVNPPPPGGVAIYYVPSSRTVSKRTPLEAPGTNSSRWVLLFTVLDEGTW